ncbi:MAG: MAPEG family protein, partial [Dinoroseobacter sp.]|nr:MAPEG family protein [Dinoroseobacter sp.]
IACTVITFSDQSDLFTSACAFPYLGARVLYIPAYYFGWRPWRSLIWFAGFIATTLILLAALF